MNKSQAHKSSISDNNNKQSKKTIPISINSNPYPFQFIFNNKKSNLVTSYVNMGNQIQKNNQKNKNSNIILISKKNTAHPLGNKNLIVQSYLSKYSVTSLLSKSNYSNKNNTQLKIPSYQILNDSNKNSEYPSFLFKAKAKNISEMKKSLNININKIINYNNSLKKNNHLKNTNFKFKKENDNHDEIFINSNYNLSKEKGNKKSESTTLNILTHNKTIIDQNKSNKVLNTLRNQIHNYFKSDNSLFGSSFINKSKKNKACRKFERKKLIEKINDNNDSIKHYTICKSYKNNYISSNKNKEDKKIENYRNKTISINLNKILKDIKIEKKKNKKNHRKHLQKNLEHPISLFQIIEKEIPKEEINENNENKIDKKETELSIITNEKKNSNIKNNNNYNDLFDENNLYEIPEDNDDKFDNLNSIVRKIQFNKILINCGNLFSVNKNNKYFQYFEKFEKEFIQNINYDKKNIKGKVVSINQSYSTQQDSSYKKKLLKN